MIRFFNRLTSGKRSSVVSYSLLAAKVSFASGLIVLGVTIFPVMAFEGKFISGIGMLLGFLPAFPFYVVFRYSALVSAPLYFFFLSILLLLPTLGLPRISGEKRRDLLQEIALCLATIGFPLFSFFCAIYGQYGTAFALNSPHREAIVQSFVPEGALGIIMLLESATLGCLIICHIIIEKLKKVNSSPE